MPRSFSADRLCEMARKAPPHSHRRKELLIRAASERLKEIRREVRAERKRKVS